MEAKNCKVVFKGELLPQVTRADAIDNLVKLFKQPKEVIEKLFSSNFVTLKTGLTESQANKYIETLLHAGVVVQKYVEKPSSAWAIEPIEEERSFQAIRDGMVCPKCQTRQSESDVCTNCGLIISKYQAQMAAGDNAAAALQATASRSVANNYRPPETTQSYASHNTDEFLVDPLDLLTFTGRIGRLRFLAWPFYAGLVFGLVFTILGFIGWSKLARLGAHSESLAHIIFNSGLFGILFGAVLLAFFVFMLMVYVKRGHDIGISTPISIAVYVVPTFIQFFGTGKVGSVMSFIVWLVYLVMQGSPRANNFGPRPPDNSLAIYIAAALNILFIIVAIYAIFYGISRF